MKKALSFALATALTVGALTGCGSGAQNSTSAGAGGQEKAADSNGSSGGGAQAVAGGTTQMANTIWCSGCIQTLF